MKKGVPMSWVYMPKLTHVRPYLKIMRFDSLTGFYLLLWPCMWSIGFSSYGGQFPFMTILQFIVGAMVMRSAGCVINDIIDRKIDSNVERTKNRPLVTGELKLFEATLLLFMLLTIAGAILLSLSNTAIILGYIIILPVFVYPFMKRITYWPQIFLAFTINWGALIAWAALRDKISFRALILYAACVFWTLGYDTIYAHQDKKDDELFGIKSAALRLGDSKKYLYIFYSLMVVLLWLEAIIMGSGLFFHVFLLVAAFQLFWQVNSLDLGDPDDCMRKFRSNRWLGLLVFIGIVAGRVAI